MLDQARFNDSAVTLLLNQMRKLDDNVWENQMTYGY